VKRAGIVAGLMLLVAAWAVAATDASMTAHMTAHMLVVALCAPLLAYGVAGTRFDPAVRWPRAASPLPMSVLELVIVWGWHLPTARAFAAASPIGLVLEQVMFAAAGLLLWSACFGARGAGVIALLLTSMHMTLLGALIALAPRTLYGSASIEDQQVGGVVMLLAGAGSYLVGGLALLSLLLRGATAGRIRQWS
jgi:putative membrane protein